MATGSIRDDAFAFGANASNGFASAADLLLRNKEEELRIVSIDVDSITEHPHNREVSAEMVDMLAASIKEVGLGQPPLVRKTGPGQYEHVSGWHRILAFRKLYAETGDPKWSKINCVVERDLDDERAERLMWDTNLCAKTLTPEERAKAWEFHAATTVKRLREEDPERYAGVPTNEIISEYIKELPGENYSPSTIARDKAKAKKAEEKKRRAEEAAEARKKQQEQARNAAPELTESPSEAVSGDQATPMPSDAENAAQGDFEPQTAPVGRPAAAPATDWTPADDIEPALDRDAYVLDQERRARDKIEKLLTRMSRMADDVADLSDDITPAYARSMMRYVKSMKATLDLTLKGGRNE